MSHTQSGPVSVVVESAVPLLEAEKKDLLVLLEKQLGKVSLTEKVTPAIIGGLKLSIGDQIIDNSLRTRLDLINKDLIQHAKK